MPDTQHSQPGILLSPSQTGNALEECPFLEPSDSSSRSTQFPEAQTLGLRRVWHWHCTSDIHQYVHTAAQFAVAVAILFAATISLAVLVNWLPAYTKSSADKKGIFTADTDAGSIERFIRFIGIDKERERHNYLQETYLMAYIAYRSNRTLVYEDNMHSLGFNVLGHSSTWILPSCEQAIKLGSICGNGLSLRMRAINEFHRSSARWYEAACPTHDKIVVNLPEVPASGIHISTLDFWKDLLKGMSERCVEIDTHKEQIFRMEWAFLLAALGIDAYYRRPFIDSSNPASSDLAINVEFL